MTRLTLTLTFALVLLSCRTTAEQDTELLATGDSPERAQVALLLSTWDEDRSKIQPKFRDSGSTYRDQERFALIPADAYLQTRERHRQNAVLCPTRDDPALCSAPATQRDPRRLLADEDVLVEHLEAMELQGLMQAEASRQPWSTDTWLPSRGLTAYRFVDEDWPETWNDAQAYAEKTTAPLSQLSPAEKYDRLIASNVLTASQWVLSDPRQEEFHDISHGWAAAATHLPRPKRSIPTAEGFDFLPADLKALGSLLWARSRYDVRYLGGLCSNESRAAVSECTTFDAGQFHVALVNAFAKGQPLIIDATLDPEIFHQPLAGYEYQYFLPEEKKLHRKLGPLLLDEDGQKRKKIGIALTLRYIAQRSPVSQATDSRDSDLRLRVHYFYLLELTGDGRIAGGEWLQTIHPDLVWAPEPGAEVVTWGDSFVRGNWRFDDGELPWSWKKGGEYDARSGKPLGKLVTTLFDSAAGVQVLSQSMRVKGYVAGKSQESCRLASTECTATPSTELTEACAKIGGEIYTCSDCRFMCSQPLGN